MRIDWQAYDDGSLGPAERAVADQALATDPSAQAELEGLRRLKSAVSAMSTEPVPIRRLESVFYRPKSTWRWATLAAVLVVATFAWAWIVFKRPTEIRFDLVGARPAVSVEGLESARLWLAAEAALDVPEGSLPVLPVKRVYRGTGWGCIEYEVGQHSVSLYVRKSHGTVKGLSTDFKYGHDVAVVRSQDRPALLWEDAGIEFLAVGQDVEDLWETVRMVRKRSRG
ncbi:MAG: hypothetical protein JST30_07390 [Armatimonadetes bacterium]|nr:hypothetical protein [Armatimonadota bacterium]